MIVDIGARKRELQEAQEIEAAKERRAAKIAAFICPRCNLSQMKDRNPESQYDSVIADCPCGMRYCDKPDRFAFNHGTNTLVWEPQQKRCLYGSFLQLMDEQGTVLPLLPYTTTIDMLDKWLALA